MHNFSVVNYTDDGIFTRETIWGNLPNNNSLVSYKKTVTLEEPCDYKDNNFERYYPVKDLSGNSSKIYNKYRNLASERKNITFIGRCGKYVYLDMDQVVNQSLMEVKKFINN